MTGFTAISSFAGRVHSERCTSRGADVLGLIEVLYTSGLVLVTLYAVGQLHLLSYLIRPRRRSTPAPFDPGDASLPRVTVQLPVFNEPMVAGEAIDTMAGLDWPADRLEIQILDDSTDETVDIVRRRVAYWRWRGIDIRHIRRPARVDYKAGALASGLESATGEFVAIFDADFRPRADFLLRVMPYFDGPSTGFVQARWGHANRRASLLTRIESVLLDVPFLVGQVARSEAGFFLRFNGSAGVWRRKCIMEAGGWSGETLAEDLDLCFRAQLTGWWGRYAADVVVDAELPQTLADFRRQQMRWVGGTAQVVRKLGSALITARIPLLVKAHAWLDLLTVIAVLPVLVTALLSVPMAWMLHGNAAWGVTTVDTSFALLPLLVWFLSVLVVTWRQQARWWKRWLAAPALFVPMLLAVLGLTPSLGTAAARGLFRRGGEFTRTPKFGANPAYRTRSSGAPVLLGELALLVYFAFALVLDVRISAAEFLPLHAVMVAAYIAVLVPAVRARSFASMARAQRSWRRRAARVSVSVIAGLMLLGWNASGAAQTSLVPARHPVYEWLHRQRVLGRAPGFSYSALPLSRGEVSGRLGAVAERDDLGATDRFLVTTYLREFSADGLARSAEENVLRGPGRIWERVPRMAREYAEPHLFAASQAGYAFAVDLMQSFEQASLDEGASSHSATLIARGVRAFADFYRHFGVHVEAGNVEARGGRELLALDPVFGKTFEVVRQGKHNSNYFEASISGQYRALSLHLGHGALRFGPGAREPIWLSRDAPSFDWIRLDLDTRHFRYVALHGSLAADAEDAELVLPDGQSLPTRIAPQRWLALHRLEVILPADVRLGISEMIAYSARGIDLAYVNPVSPLFLAELDNHDRDNAVLGLDLTWQPVGGVELHGGVFVDDALEESDIVVPTSRRGAARAFDVGVTGAHAAGLDGGLRYVRIEPFVYAHVQPLNALEQRGFALGHALGPNADAAEAWLRIWLPRRTTLVVSLRRARKGLNRIDAEGAVTENVGGDFYEDFEQQPYAFLESADVQRWNELSLDASVEPWRGVRLSVRVQHRDVVSGDRIADRTYLDARLGIGF
ncbi:MAG: glycosyltransferase [Gemmatimonadetes bacterium]|nr:glycosyltransferase [Gemmatimonadota bacterium]